MLIVHTDVVCNLLLMLHLQYNTQHLDGEGQMLVMVLAGDHQVLLFHYNTSFTVT
jgi:hypothetical protein